MREPDAIDAFIALTPALQIRFIERLASCHAQALKMRYLRWAKAQDDYPLTAGVYAKLLEQISPREYADAHQPSSVRAQLTPGALADLRRKRGSSAAHDQTYGQSVDPSGAQALFGGDGDAGEEPDCDR